MGPSPRDLLTISVALLWPFQRAYSRLGFDMAPSAARFGLSLARLADPQTRVTWRAALDDLAEAVQRMKRTDVGLLAAQCVLPGDFGALELAARACSTIGEAVSLIARSFEIMAQGMHLSVEARGDRTVVRLWCEPGLDLPPQSIEFAFLSVLLLGAVYAEEVVTPKLVRFAFPAPPHAKACEEVFRCPVRYDATDSEVEYDTASFAIPLHTADRWTAEAMRAHVADLIAVARRRDPVVERVEQEVARRLTEGVPSIAEIVRTLGTSERTLHRKLKLAGTSYRALCDGLRMRLAMHYLEHTRWPIKEVASALGFSEVQAFHRAFKRLTGRTPAQHRERHAASGASGAGGAT